MRFLGRSLSSANALDAPVADRLRDLWESRVQAVRNGADAAELTAFGEWFGAGKLGDAGNCSSSSRHCLWPAASNPSTRPCHDSPH
jgi:hypothetical protein